MVTKTTTPKTAAKPAAKPRAGKTATATAKTADATTAEAAPRKPRVTKPQVAKPKPMAAEGSVRDHAQKLASQAGDKARAAAKDGMGKASAILDDVAATVHESAKTVEKRFGKPYGDYARKAAEAVSGAASSVKGKEVDEMLESARGFVKKNPFAAAGAAAAIGFALMRLFRAGSDDTDADA